MSLFKKPKKTIQRRVFSSAYDVDEDNENENDSNEVRPVNESTSVSKSEEKEKKSSKKSSKEDKKSSGRPLLSFNDEEEEEEVFQVKKSSHSKKVMKQLDKERRKKKSKDTDRESKRDIVDDTGRTASAGESSTKSLNNTDKYDNSNKIQTEIRTDDFVLVVKNSEPQNEIILNGRAALCAGRDDMSSEDEENEPVETKPSKHKFSKPNNMREILESGVIPDAAMIHAARKSRQKARELGDFAPLEEPEEEPSTSKANTNRITIDDGDDDDVSDDDRRVDMADITGTKEKEERREQFYAAENQYSSDASDEEMKEWENQQIRKGVSGAQVTKPLNDPNYSQYISKPTLKGDEKKVNDNSLTAQIEKCLSEVSLEAVKEFLTIVKADDKVTRPQKTEEIVDRINTRLEKMEALREKHRLQIIEMEQQLEKLAAEQIESEEQAEIADKKFEYFSQFEFYVQNLDECFNVKVPMIDVLYAKTLEIYEKSAVRLIERRRCDIQDQSKEIAELNKPPASRKPTLDDEDRVRRAAEREGRKNRRRRNREKMNLIDSHLDGMSSDDEIPDQEIEQFKRDMSQLEQESNTIFDDVSENYCDIKLILAKFEDWRKFDIKAYTDSYTNLCLPKLLSPIVKFKLYNWNPMIENCVEIERMDWFNSIIMYGASENDTEESMIKDPDLRLIPTLIEKVILPRLTELIEKCWDPLSTTQTLKLVVLIRRLGEDYPSLRPKSKHLRALLMAVLDKMKLSLENDVFIPIFAKQSIDAKTSFFQRQFCSGLKFFRNLLSWQGIIADEPLKELTITSMLNRYFLSGMRICNPIDAVNKAMIIMNTIPRCWVQKSSPILPDFGMFINYLQLLVTRLDRKNSAHLESLETIDKILSRLHVTN